MLKGLSKTLVAAIAGTVGIGGGISADKVYEKVIADMSTRYAHVDHTHSTEVHVQDVTSYESALTDIKKHIDSKVIYTCGKE